MSTTLLTTEQLALRFFELVSEGKFEEAQYAYFSSDIVSIEIADGNGLRKKDEGLQAIAEKREAFQAIVKSVESLKVGQPIIQGNSFAFTFELQFTTKAGDQQLLSEICVYQVEKGKIVLEQFFN